MIDLTDYVPTSILVRMPNWIGDMVMATPVLTALRAKYPNARITAMSRFPGCDLLEEDKDIDELFCFRKAGVFVRRSERRDIIGKIGGGKYDLGILLTHSFSSAWWFWQGKVKYRIGYDTKGRGLLLSHRIPFPKDVETKHLVYTYQNLLAPLGITDHSHTPRIYLQKHEIEQAKALLKTFGIEENHRVIGINPGATYGSAKCWLPERFREVTQKLLEEKNLSVVYFGDQSSLGLVKEICRGLDSRVVNLAGVTTLRELACLISLCDVLLTNDSGPMHIAAALNTPLVALFGSTNEIVTGPFNSGIVIHKHVECSPCYQRTCPIDFRCMKGISSEEVYHQIMKLLHPTSMKLPIHIK